jgi:fused signal recognition particle receptor
MINENWLNIVGFGGAGLIIFIFFILILFRNKKNKKIQIAEQKIKAEIQAQPPTWLTRLREGLERTRSNLAYGLSEFFLTHKDKITRDATLEKLFEILISCDVGVETTEHLVSRVKNKMTAADINDYKSFESLLKAEILELLSHLPNNPKGTIEHTQFSPHVVLLVGVNGVGKTTTTGKLAYIAAQQQKKVIIGAADTFRAAAVEQLAIWAQRANAELIQLKDNADPASVAFECVKRAVQENFNLCLIDTAGRLQTRQDLMQELSKVWRVISKNMPEAPHEVLLVLDASMGQNAIEQAKLFQASVHVTGIVLTKLDGTAKGGVVLAIASKLKLPIRYIGVGEGVEDLQPFNANEYTEALFS